MSHKKMNYTINYQYFKKILIFILLGYVSFVNIFYIFLFNLTDTFFFITIFPATKDLAFLIFCFLAGYEALLSKKTKVRKDEYLLVFFILFYCLWVCLSFVLSNAPITFKLYGGRQLLLFILVLCAFKIISFSEKDLISLKKVLVFITITLGIFGLFEYFLPDAFWDEVIGMPKYVGSRFLAGVNKVNSIADSGGRGYSSDLFFILGERVRRMMSLFAEPTTLGIFFTFSLSYFSFAKDIPYRSFAVFISLICGFLVYSKIFLVSIFVILMFKLILKKPRFYPLVIFTFLLYILAEFLFTGIGKIHGSFGHLFGFYSGINLLLSYPLGFGLGMAGNRGFLDHNTIMGEFGGESGLGNILAQIGIPGIAFFVILILAMKSFKKSFDETRNSDYLAVFVCMFNYIINFYLSAASLGLTGNVLFFIVGGVYLNTTIKKEYNA